MKLVTIKPNNYDYNQITANRGVAMDQCIKKALSKGCSVELVLSNDGSNILAWEAIEPDTTNADLEALELQAINHWQNTIEPL